MKIGYAMIRNSTDPIEDQIISLKNIGCSLIYKDIRINNDSGFLGLRDLLENLKNGNTVAIESLNIIGHNMESPMGFFDILIEKQCSLELTNRKETFLPDQLIQLKIMWEDLLKCREKSKSRSVKKALTNRSKD